MNQQLFHKMTDFCFTITQLSKDSIDSDEKYLFFDSENKHYTDAQGFAFFDRLVFKDVYDEAYQHEFRQQYLDAKLLTVEPDGIRIHKGLEYILFYYLFSTLKDQIRDYLILLHLEAGKALIKLHGKSYEIDKHYYKNILEPQFYNSIDNFRNIAYLFEHIAGFIYRATDFVMVEKNAIEFVQNYIKRFHFEKIAASLNELQTEK